MGLVLPSRSGSARGVDARGVAAGTGDMLVSGIVLVGGVRMKLCVVPGKIVHALGLATLAIFCGEGAPGAGTENPVPTQDEFALFERPLLELAGPDLEVTLLDLERAICDLARLGLEEDCEHLLRVAGALRWQAVSSGKLVSFGATEPPAGIEKLEELAWIACGLRARQRVHESDLVGWAVKAGLVDLVDRDDPESHWIRGQSPSDVGLLLLSARAMDAARTPRA